MTLDPRQLCEPHTLDSGGKPGMAVDETAHFRMRASDKLERRHGKRRLVPKAAF